MSFAFHYYKNRYPKEYETYANQLFEYLQQNDQLKQLLPYIIKIGYAFIYVYSYCQIILNKIIIVTSPYVKLLRDKTRDYLVKHNIISDRTSISSSSISINKRSIISFYIEGALVNTVELSSNLEALTQQDIKSYIPTSAYNLVTIFDFIIPELDENKKQNILTFIPDDCNDCKYELSNISFIALYLKQDDNSHIINLCENNNNYYVVGNIINSAFLKYYLKNVLNVIIDNDKPFVYILELMDHNVNMVYLDETQSIVIQKDGYNITDKVSVSVNVNVNNEVLKVVEDIIDTVVSAEELSKAELLLAKELSAAELLLSEELSEIEINLENLVNLETVVNLENLENLE